MVITFSVKFDARGNIYIFEYKKIKQSFDLTYAL